MHMRYLCWIRLLPIPMLSLFLEGGVGAILGSKLFVIAEQTYKS